MKLLLNIPVGRYTDLYRYLQRREQLRELESGPPGCSGISPRSPAGAAARCRDSAAAPPNDEDR